MSELKTPPMGILVVGRQVERSTRPARYLASGLIMLTVVVAWLVVWQACNSFTLVRDLHAVTVEQVRAAENRAEVLAWAWLVGLGVSGVAFVVWLWRARANKTRARFGKVWVIGAWLVPVANLWLPYAVVRDVRASKLVTVWWLTFLAAHIVDAIAVFGLAGQTAQALWDVFLADVVSAGLITVSATAILVVMRRA